MINRLGLVWTQHREFETQFDDPVRGGVEVKVLLRTGHIVKLKVAQTCSMLILGMYVYIYDRFFARAYYTLQKVSETHSKPIEM